MSLPNGHVGLAAITTKLSDCLGDHSLDSELLREILTVALRLLVGGLQPAGSTAGFRLTTVMPIEQGCPMNDLLEVPHHTDLYDLPVDVVNLDSLELFASLRMQTMEVSLT